MAELVEKMGIKRKPGWLYFLRGSSAYKVQMLTHSQRRGKKLKAKLVKRGKFKRDPNYLYYINSNGDIARAKRVYPPGRYRSPLL